MEWKQHIRLEDVAQHLANHTQQLPLKGSRNEADYHPVIKLFAPIGAATWLISEVDEDGIAFGLCDLGMGEPELGSVDLNEVFELLLWGHIRIEQDQHWQAKMTLSQYAKEARSLRRINA